MNSYRRKHFFIVYLPVQSHEEVVPVLHSVGIMLGWDKALYQLNITSTDMSESGFVQS